MPALPTRVTRRIVSSSRRSSANACSLLRGRTPITPSRPTRSDTISPREASKRPSAVWFGAPVSRIITQALAWSAPGAGGVKRPFWKKASTSAPVTSTSSTECDSSGSLTRWFSYVSAVTPSASARMRRFVVPSSRRSWASRRRGRARRSPSGGWPGPGSSTPARPARRGAARGWRCAGCHRSPGGRPWPGSCPDRWRSSSRRRSDGAGVAAPLRSFALELVDLLDGEDRDDEIVVLELEDRVGSWSRTLASKDVVLLHGASDSGDPADPGRGA